MTFPAGRLARDDAVSSMTRSGHRDGCASIAFAAMATPRLSSPGLRPFLAETRKSLRRRPALRSGPDGCVVDRLRPFDRHRDRGGRGLGQPGRNHMATIGTFESVGDSEYLGDIFTLSLRAKNVRIVSVSRTNENAPSHRIYIDQVDYAE
jgi:hypothetical protein